MMKESRKKAAKLRFIGQQFANMKVDIKALVEEEKAKADVYDFEWERKEKDPNWKQGLLKASIKPQEGLDYLAKMDLIEDTVEDIEAQSRRLLDFLDLPFEEGVLSFYATKRVVKTPSASQVREPIYKSSIAAWKKYEKHLGPLIENLEVV